MPTQDQAHRAAARLIAASRAVVTEPDSLDRRQDLVRVAFNIDFTAAAIVLLADQRLRLLGAVKQAEQFIAGFADDPAQAGIGALLDELRRSHGDAAQPQAAEADQ
jgi:hypothetical protein